MNNESYTEILLFQNKSADNQFKISINSFQNQLLILKFYIIYIYR